MNVIAPNAGLKEGLAKRLNGVSELLHQVAQLRKSQKRIKAILTDGDPQAQIKLDEVAEMSSANVVHDFRIACRRAETALTVCGHQAKESELKWLRNQLNEIRHFCNSLRDHEVFTKWLKKQSKSTARRELLADVAQQIDRESPKVARQARSLIKKRDIDGRIRAVLTRNADSEERDGVAFDSEVHKRDPQRLSDTPHLAIIRTMPPAESVSVDRLNGHHKRPSEWTTVDSSSRECRRVAKWLFLKLNEFVQNLPDDPGELDALHAFRISSKRLRYGIEFISEIEPRLQLTSPLNLLQSIQEKLGTVHDAIVRQARLNKTRPHSRGSKALLRAAEAELTQSQSEWIDWWQPANCQQIIRQTVVEIGKLLN